MTKLTQSIVSYPQRGKWGSGAWDGNTSGHLIIDLIDTYCPGSVLDPMEGSGTTGDVCRERGIPYWGFDLKQGYDIGNHRDRSRMEHEMTLPVDMVFLHPPYWGMVRYSNSAVDLCNGPYPVYLTRMQSVLKWAASLLSPQGFIALLLGDYRIGQTGKTYFLTDDLTPLGQMLSIGLEKEARLIKVQHMTNSRGKVDHPGGFAFVHEYVTILRKRGAFLVQP